MPSGPLRESITRGLSRTNLVIIIGKISKEIKTKENLSGLPFVDIPITTEQKKEIDDIIAKGDKISLIGKDRMRIFKDKMKKISNISLKLDKIFISPSKASIFGIKIAKDGVYRSACSVLSRKGVNMHKIRQIWPQMPNFGKN